MTAEIANRIKLVMTDVDGTLLASGDNVCSGVAEAITGLSDLGISIGLVSGRTLSQLVEMALELKIDGPVIAENGGVARVTPRGRAVDLGYSREPALSGLEKLKKLFPGDITEREDNIDRTVDVVFRAGGIPVDKLKENVNGIQLLDSGYILHLMQEGISKGNTLMRLLNENVAGKYSLEEVMVFGDSATDISLFELFPMNVLVKNPGLPEGQREMMEEAAMYISEREYDEGFTEVATHIINLRSAGI